MGRPEESGYRSQLYILLVLREFGPLYGQEIVDKTGLHREEVWRNLKVLFRKGIIEKEKVGRKVYYRPNVDTQTLEYIISILHEGGFRKTVNKTRKLFKKMKKPFNQLISAAELVEKYEDELIELAYTSRMEPYFEYLPYAKIRKETKKEKARILLEKPIHLPESRKKEIREQLKHPKKHKTKEVQLSSGARFVIRKFTALEILDIVRRIRKAEKQQREIDPYLLEAMKRLTS